MMEQALEGGGLRIVFTRLGDRFAHTIEAFIDERFRSVLSSMEGTADEAWPPSPPFQQLHFEERPGGVRVALLVGMAGTSHWSAAVELDPATGEATFDVACRLRSVPMHLGSRYRIHEPSGFVLIPTEGTLGQVPDQAAVFPEKSTVNMPATLRWRYVVCQPKQCGVDP